MAVPFPAKRWPLDGAILGLKDFGLSNLQRYGYAGACVVPTHRSLASFGGLIQ